MDEESLDKIAVYTGHKLWGAFVTFGSTSAGIIAIFIILRLIKYIANTLIHGYAFHKMYGWSLQLVGALWGSLTNFLLHFANKPTTEKLEKRNEPAEIAITMSQLEE